MRPCVFDDRDQVMILSLLNQFKRSCDSNRVSKSMALWILPNFMRKDPRASFNNLIVPIFVSHDAYARPGAGGDRTGTYAEVVHHQLKWYATNSNIANDTSEISKFRKMAKRFRGTVCRCSAP